MNEPPKFMTDRQFKDWFITTAWLVNLSRECKHINGSQSNTPKAGSGRL